MPTDRHAFGYYELYYAGQRAPKSLSDGTVGHLDCFCEWQPRDVTVTVTTGTTSPTTSPGAVTVSIVTTRNASEMGPVSGTAVVTLSGPLPVPVAVFYSSTGGTATAGQDYVPLSGVVQFGANVTSVTITVTPIPDSVVEGVETVVLTLTGSSDVNVVGVGSPSVATVSIADALVVTVVTVQSGSEVGPVPAIFAVKLSGAALVDTSVAYKLGGTATNGTDYAPLSGIVTIPAGSSMANITVNVVPDTVVEGTETVIVTLTNSFTSTTLIGTPSTASAIIAEAVVVTVVATANGTEVGPVNGQFQVSLSSPLTTSVTIAYSVGGTATPGQDYLALTGTVTLGAGQTTAPITVAVIPDAVLEGPETVVLTLDSTSTAQVVVGTPNVATVFILDRIGLTVVAVPTRINESGQQTSRVYFVLSEPAAVVVCVTYSLGGTAINGADYQPISGTLVNIPVGQLNASITILPIPDVIPEGPETVVVTAVSLCTADVVIGSPASATVTIDDTNVATLVGTSNGTEIGPVAGIVTVQLTQPSLVDVVLTYTLGGTATNGTDYAPLSGQVTVPAGQTSAQIVVNTIVDSVVEGPESVVVTLVSSSTPLVGIGTPNTATIFITDNIVATVVASTPVASENGPTNGVFTVQLSAPLSTNVTLVFTLGGTATPGADFVAVPTSVTIPAGQTTATVVITPLPDSLLEPTETVVLTLVSSSDPAVVVGQPSSATVTILDASGTTTAAPTTSPAPPSSACGLTGLPCAGTCGVQGTTCTQVGGSCACMVTCASVNPFAHPSGCGVGGCTQGQCVLLSDGQSCGCTAPRVSGATDQTELLIIIGVPSGLLALALLALFAGMDKDVVMKHKDQ